jgi:hypothetical protein
MKAAAMEIVILVAMTIASIGCSDKCSSCSSHDSGEPRDMVTQDEVSSGASDVAQIDSVDDSGGDSTDGSFEDTPVCAADFPCFGYNFICVGYDTYSAAVSHDCHFTCGPGPCMGGTCEPTGLILTCPSGTRCANRLQWSSSGGQQPCALIDGGMDGTDE